MKFNIESSESFYSKEEADKLRVLGFEFAEPPRDGTYFSNKYYKIKEGDTLEISSIEELMAFQKKWGTLVLTDHGDPTIEI